MSADGLLVRQLGLRDYCAVWRAMQAFTQQRQADSSDEAWLVEHPPVFTQGQAGKAEHILQASTIPIVPTDRGGQVTYHAPGQLIVYLLIDLKRQRLTARSLVSAMENSLIKRLNDYAIKAHARSDAPGVYSDDGSKIAQLGLRIRRGCSYHGLSLNVDMDLQPFQWINPCGYQGLSVTSMVEQGANVPSLAVLGDQLVSTLNNELGYTKDWCCEQRIPIHHPLSDNHA